MMRLLELLAGLTHHPEPTPVPGAEVREPPPPADVPEESGIYRIVRRDGGFELRRTDLSRRT